MSEERKIVGGFIQTGWRVRGDVYTTTPTVCVCSLSVPPEAKQLLGVEQYVCATHEGRGVFTLSALQPPTCCGACVESAALRGALKEAE